MGVCKLWTCDLDWDEAPNAMSDHAGDADRTVIVFVRDISIEAPIGALADEVGRRQTLLIDIELQTRLSGRDSLGDTVDYRQLVAAARAIAEDHVVLVETFAFRLAQACLEMPDVTVVEVTVRKPSALFPATAGAKVRRERLQ